VSFLLQFEAELCAIVVSVDRRGRTKMRKVVDVDGKKEEQETAELAVFVGQCAASDVVDQCLGNLC
jgi:hypothetical protein